VTSGDKQSGFMSDINVTPFVDVMLVLLIIFMVTAPMMMQGVDVALPEATSEPLEAETDTLLVSIDNQGRVFVSDVEVAVEALGDKLARILAGRKNRDIYLKADKDIPYGIVVRVMSEVKAAGVERLGMVTLPATDEKPASRP
jgi:biopolymer transport protein TolR